MRVCNEKGGRFDKAMVTRLEFAIENSLIFVSLVTVYDIECSFSMCSLFTNRIFFFFFFLSLLQRHYLGLDSMVRAWLITRTRSRPK